MLSFGEMIQTNTTVLQRREVGGDQNVSLKWVNIFFLNRAG